MKYVYILILLLISGVIFANASFFDDSKLDNPKLIKAIELYDGLDFKKAKKEFNILITTTENRMEKATAIKYMAFIYTLAQDDDNAEKYYSQLFDIYPDFILDYDSVTPKISEYFKDYKEIWLRTPNTKVKVYKILKDKVVYDAGIKIDMEWHDPNLEVGYVILKYKSKKDPKFSHLEKRDIKANNYIINFELSFLNDPTIDFNLEYYLEVYDYDGKLMFKVDNDNKPISVYINVPGGAIVDGDFSEKPAAWYSSTWFITTATVLFVGAIGGGAYYYFSDQGTTVGEPENAKINIYITNGN